MHAAHSPCAHAIYQAVCQRTTHRPYCKLFIKPFANAQIVGLNANYSSTLLTKHKSSTLMQTATYLQAIHLPLHILLADSCEYVQPINHCILNSRAYVQLSHTEEARAHQQSRHSQIMIIHTLTTKHDFYFCLTVTQQTLKSYVLGLTSCVRLKSLTAS